jgi:hypothetical protein
MTEEKEKVTHQGPSALNFENIGYKKPGDAGEALGWVPMVIIGG